MTWQVAGALAVPFALDATEIDFTIGATTYTATIATGTFRIGLAPASTDVLRVLATALAAAPGLPGGTTFAVTLSTTTGLVSITCSSSWQATDLHSSTLGAILGFASAPALGTVATATRAPWYLGLAVAVQPGLWQPKTPGGAERDSAGRVYMLAGSVTTYDTTVALSLVPRDPTLATEAASPATPLLPDAQYRHLLGSTATSRAWSWLDVLTIARNVQCAWCPYDLASLLASTTMRYDLVWVGYGGDGLDTPVTRGDLAWERYTGMTFSLTLPAEAHTATRA